MNYRHAFHAGNFADVVKHMVLARILVHLCGKDAAFRVIDTHAGRGLYDLADEASQRTGEWHAGIGRLDETPLAGPAADLAAPYLEAVQATRALAGPMAYPGSPALAQHLARSQDRLVFVEKHPAEAEALRAAMGRDKRARVVELDGWTALNAYVPPPEKRGLVLLDPPFEELGEFDRMAQRLMQAWRKWPTGVYAAWYPVKEPDAVARFHAAVAASGVQRVLDLRVLRRLPTVPATLVGTGMVVVNPPWRLADEMAVLLPALADRLGSGSTASWSCNWLVPEQDRG